ncbi:MAG: flagellar basal body P-ring formation chaperone FlgA [Alphaproteobacteria bacterium]|nr:flagellar basal body P-ring formation chaperone FlgA [Alphaproteobacteria bacterium]MBU1515576.1 flagellar basal body P-ring formation chaperone FlgA [Alphaproteobacteria bacterium]MBU2095574.1 flagellar basal body P-ring formation chaperone FlgA [Alphaproteobacteria bacterium]MBU2150815.1 flagellar basal body P-ring formation chaperone FlgA [Alphaproteobacteria bacterium]MBU2307080.1 flagellar basal body P-ring formation chaperone FlgA [Alphaproteobacteria bacterium]
MKAFVFLATLVLATPALAATPVTLKADAVDADGVVTLGDIFNGTGAAGATPVASRTGASVMLSAAAVRGAAARAGLDWANAEGLRQIVVRGGVAATGPANIAARGNVDVLTWARSISAGEMVQPQDLVWGKAAMAPADAPNDPDAVVGMAARRALRAGAPVASRDVAAPMVIKANEIVTLTYDNQGVSLALQANALSGGAIGETINVQNVTSKKTVTAVVTGPGQAAVGPGADELKLARSSRYALR